MSQTSGEVPGLIEGHSSSSGRVQPSLEIRQVISPDLACVLQSGDFRFLHKTHGNVARLEEAAKSWSIVLHLLVHISALKRTRPLADKILNLRLCAPIRRRWISNPAARTP